MSNSKDSGRDGKLNIELEIIDSKVNHAYKLLNDAVGQTQKLKYLFDLDEPSQEILDHWANDLAKCIDPIFYHSDEFEMFAFDGDTIREIDDEEN